MTEICQNWRKPRLSTRIFPRTVTLSAGAQGSPGEVTAQQLTDAIVGTSANIHHVSRGHSVQLLNLTVSDLPTTIAKLNELISALRR